ncbi:MAG: hypothetical protein CBC71_06210 [Rhodobacteraceae bacterium TMED111]|nr:hypothetical protein [Marinovum sp.]OUV41092.1 MAG: hypothetical protein CBC71_06210 [Rhodobacteraceae bacterium TMED111]|tara:strand:- start:21166 stop:21468 length:303 start_codon:yes stop_codon:yes gene_type:complete
MSKTIDFTRNTWGHAIHGFTLSREPLKYGSWLTRLLDKYKGQYRKSVMVHSSVYPYKGDFIKYKTEGGVIRAEIYDVKPSFDPRDMFTLHLIFRPKEGYF